MSRGRRRGAQVGGPGEAASVGLRRREQEPVGGASSPKNFGAEFARTPLGALAGGAVGR